MAANILTTLRYMIQGFRDSIVGIFNLKALDKDETDNTSEDERPLTSLAVRRAGRNKGKDTKPKEPMRKKPKLAIRIINCCTLNGGVFATSIIIFDYILLPAIQGLSYTIFGGSTTNNVIVSWISFLISVIFSGLWVLPLFFLSKVVNAFWFQDIADTVYRKRRGRPLMFPSISKSIADIVFSIIFQSLFLIQGTLCSLLPIPVVGFLVSQVHMTLLYSLYAFEYKWFNMGWEIHKRLTFIETNWPYFVGFGLPLSLLTSLPQNMFISGCVFAVLFPLFIISANEAETLKTTYEFPLRLFTPLARFTDKVFEYTMKSTKGLASPKKCERAKGSASPKKSERTKGLASPKKSEGRPKSEPPLPDGKTSRYGRKIVAPKRLIL